MLSTPLLMADRTLGTLNIYSTADRAFGLEQQKLAALFATQAATILTDAGVTPPDSPILTAGSPIALHARELIAQAQGVVMACPSRRSRVDSASIRVERGGVGLGPGSRSRRFDP